MPDGPTAHGGGRVPAAPLRVRIVASDAAVRRRLAEVLTGVDGIEIAGGRRSASSPGRSA